MAGPCCGTHPLFLRDGKWACTTCESEVPAANSPNTLYPPVTDYNWGMELLPGGAGNTIKCECGAEKTYGEGATHSFWCPKYKKGS